MRFGPRVALLSTLLLLAVSVPVAGGAAEAAAPANTQPSLQSDGLSRTAVNLTLQLQADGDARWVVETTFRLRTADDRRAFDRLTRSFEAGEADVAYDIGTFRRASAAASEATGRSMQIRGVNRTATRTTVNNTTVGRLQLTFTWTNFARLSGDRLVVDDAFNTTSGTWLPGLAADQRLIVSPPPNYSVYDAPISVQRGRLVWTGPRNFSPSYLDITFRQTGGGTDTPDEGLTPVMLGFLAAVVVGIGALALAGYAWARRRGEATAEPEAPAEPAAEQEAAAESPAEEADEHGEEGVDLELLSDEERVEHLLEERAGRMKQADIVKETGWSNAKVSQLLSSMEEEGRIDKLRIGRENLITLPDEDVTDFDE